MNLLDGVNRSLKRARLIQGESGELTSLVSTSYQTDVDLMVDSWNEVIRHVYDYTNDKVSLPHGSNEGTITLVDGTREYAPAAGFERMAIETMVDQTNGYIITPYPGGHDQLFRDQIIPTSYVGRPNYWVINPVNGNFRFDMIPSAGEDGDVYTYQFEKRLVFTLATDNFPFSDTVAEELVPAVFEKWKLFTKPETFSIAAFNIAVSQAISTLAHVEKKSSYVQKRTR